MKKKWIAAIGGAVALLLFLVLLIALNRAVVRDTPTAASQLRFNRAHVVEIAEEDAYEDTWTEGRRLGTQLVTVELDGGAYDGQQLPAVNYLNAYANVDLKTGTRIIVRLDTDDTGATYVASVANYDRCAVLLGLVLVFMALIVLLAGKKGVMALGGLLFTVVCIWFFLIPMLELGAPPIPATVLLVAVTAAVSLLLLNGFTSKTACATAGCVGGVAIAGIAAALAGALTPINGFNMAEAEELVLRAADSGLKISGLLVSGVLISALGAVMDVAMTITSAVFEVHAVNPAADRRALLRSGMNIGRDAMGTMTNTLILAFAGASLNTLVLFRTFNYPYIQIFNSDMMAIELIQGVAGSIGVVMTVPLVAVLSAFLCTRKKK
jgi:uncharacterized membrane protein